MQVSKSAREMFDKVRHALDTEPFDRHLFTVQSGDKHIQLVVRYVGRKMSYLVSLHVRRDDDQNPGHFKYEQEFGQEYARYDRAMKELKRIYYGKE